MNYQRFMNLLCQELSCALPPDLCPQIQHVVKNNDDVQDYVIFTPTSSNKTSGIYPSLALEPLYEQFCEGQTIVQMVSDILELLTHTPDNTSIRPEQFETFDQVKSHLCLKLVSKDNNRLLLQDTPYLDYYDLAMVCVFFQAVQETSVVSSALIHKPCLEMWGIDQRTLFAAAAQNTPQLMHPRLYRLDELMQQNPHFQSLQPAHNNMYILTNEHHYLGAVCISFPEVLHSLAATLSSDLVLIPSSIHEIIILPKSDDLPEDINEIIVSVNREAVEVQDRLSDHCYYYDRARREIHY